MYRIPFAISLLLFAIHVVGSSLVVYFVSFGQAKADLQKITERVNEDLQFRDGKWDTYYYNSDPQLPNTYPLYILTTDGFVIDRWKPVKGYLDVSDFKHLLEFENPQTITTITDQRWRVVSQPVKNQEKVIGVITVSTFNPDERVIDEIDAKLRQDLNTIAAKITINNSEIEVQDLDVRDIRFDTTFQIVNQFNKILAKNNNNNSIDRLPNFIDASYVEQELKSKPIKIITDAQTQEQFLVVLKPITDAQQSPIGIIVAGRSIQTTISLIKQLVFWQTLLILPLFFVIAFIVTRKLRTAQHSQLGIFQQKSKKLKDVIQLSFDPKASQIIIDEIIIPIAYASNQYYFCKALFSAPKKRWEVDELLDRFGEEQKQSGWRIVYDTMLLVNKKISQYFGDRLIIVKDKTYLINPDLVSKISQS